jgi:diguanylate cyclase (GGDEF)-like protein/PAS domain S-box-containing protein
MDASARSANTGKPVIELFLLRAPLSSHQLPVYRYWHRPTSIYSFGIKDGNAREELRMEVQSVRFSGSPTEQSLFKQLFDLSPNPTWLIQGNRFVECNDAAVQTLGYASREDFLNLHPSRLSPPVQADGEDSYAKAEHLLEITRTQGQHRFEWLHSKANGTDLIADVTLTCIEYEGKSVIYCVWRDITAQRSAERALRESELLYRDVVDNGQALIWLAGLDKGCYYFNQPWLRFTGRTLEQEYGEGWAEGVHPDDLQRCLAIYVAAFDRRERFSMVYRLRRRDGAYRWIVDDGAPRFDTQQTFIGYVGHCLDITEQKEVEDQVREMAFYDPLTKLLNRRLFIDRLNQTMAATKRNACYGALMFLDLDNFKPLNDRYGHEVGDALLVEVAGRLAACVREVDTVARYGGDEFVVVLSDLHETKVESISQAAIIAEKIRTSLSAPYSLPVHRATERVSSIVHRASASIGVVVFVGSDVHQDELLERADAAMYRAKEAGRNLIRFHDAEV